MSREPRPPATEEQISGAEHALGVRFPATLRRMFLEQNGGSLRGMHQESCHEIRPIGDTYPRIDVNDPWWHNDEYWQPEPPLNLLVPFCGDGHHDLCLDYRRCGPTGEPEVCMISQGGPEYLVAASFDEFLDHTVTHAATVIIEAGNEIETIAEQIGAAIDAQAVNHYGNFSRVSAERDLIVSNNRIQAEGLTGEHFEVPEHPVDAVLIQCVVDDGTLDFVPRWKWRESQPAIAAAIAEAQSYVTNAVAAAGLA